MDNLRMRSCGVKFHYHCVCGSLIVKKGQQYNLTEPDELFLIKVLSFAISPKKIEKWNLLVPFELIKSNREISVDFASVKDTMFRSYSTLQKGTCLTTNLVILGHHRHSW